MANAQEPEPTAAPEQQVDNTASFKAIAAALTIGLAAAAGALAMGIAISKSSESISRQPEADEKIRGSLLLGLIFIETAIIYALVVAILIIFVL
jgi:F-type H+-transporting ATPase subunit c